MGQVSTPGYLPFFVSMVIKLYSTVSPDNMLSKVLQDELVVNGELNRDFDLLRPTFRITEHIEDAKELNYLVVPEWERNYFIRSFNQFRTGVLDIYCKEDVLSTYAPEIRACQAFFTYGQNPPQYVPGAMSPVDLRERLTATYTFDNPFTDGSFVLVGIKGERNLVVE